MIVDAIYKDPPPISRNARLPLLLMGPQKEDLSALQDSQQEPHSQLAQDRRDGKAG